ncbi:MAG: hypothetical protein ACM3ZF_08755, partial [Mycobacterium leprae]
TADRASGSTASRAVASTRWVGRSTSSCGSAGTARTAVAPASCSRDQARDLPSGRQVDDELVGDLSVVPAMHLEGQDVPAAAAHRRGEPGEPARLVGHVHADSPQGHGAPPVHPIIAG